MSCKEVEGPLKGSIQLLEIGSTGIYRSVTSITEEKMMKEPPGTIYEKRFT